MDQAVVRHVLHADPQPPAGAGRCHRRPLTTNAQGVLQFDAFTESPPYTRTDDGATGQSSIEVPANDALFQETLSGVVDLLKTGAGTLSLIDAASDYGATPARA